ncbi:cysteine desulfurase family protein [Novosphingobium aureum]|uniref:cysteine desulfurase family protein n=1 Tax=Novosphingobium aureum TaxID=2792964 RepID=UPI001E2830AA|nr:aminotransferase class V-fold PLP-dependent enzyme [Novosphingobium aureum]
MSTKTESQISSPNQHADIYLDHAATTPLLPEAREAWLEGAALWANPSSPHKAGRAARAALEGARERIAKVLGWQGEIVFTSGASEALALALRATKAPLLATSPVEHEALLRHAAGAARLGVDANGRVSPEVDANGRVSPESAALAGLVAVQQINSETGVIQLLAQIAEAVHAAGGLLLADCAQGAGKIALPPADIVALAAHKFGGPIGVGALLVRDWALLLPEGGQERGYRGGTENLPGVLAMAAALEAGSDWIEHARGLRARLEQGILAAGGEIVAQDAERIATIGAYRMPGKPSAVQLIRFDGLGIAVSAGSACSSGSLRNSHVLDAMGYPHPQEVIRVSIGRETTALEIDTFIAAWREIAGVGGKP